ncbi:3541_t:CDS:2, partial [Racocetra persica]
ELLNRVNEIKISARLNNRNNLSSVPMEKAKSNTDTSTLGNPVITSSKMKTRTLSAPSKPMNISLRRSNLSLTIDTEKLSRLSVSRLSVASDRLSVASSRLSVVSSRSRRSSFSRSIHEETNFSEYNVEITNLKKCSKCGQQASQDWCRKCESKRFKKLSKKWTSGNEYLDKLIKYTQHKAYGPCSFWEWIPYEGFSDVQYLSKGEFGTMFVATWVNGPRDLWDDDLQQYVRRKSYKVALKRLDKNIINL